MKTALIAAAVTALAVPAAAGQPAPPAPPVPTLGAAVELSRTAAADATQGAAADARHFYAVANSRIGKYDKATGRKVAEWQGSRVQFPHLNSCTIVAKELVCANSNYPQLPMTSSVEVFNPETMTHIRSVPLGPGIGSVTWVLRRDGFWWAGFANYDVDGAEPGRDHRFTTFVKYDDQFRRLSAWAFPASVLERFKPTSASGGGWGDDGLLYVTGHDLPELYVLRLPLAGSVLEHLATIPIQVEGQAIAWDPSQKRVLYGISRQGRSVVSMRVPEFTPPAPVKP